ncbi:MAG: HupE/UreJ family protein [Sphingomonadales bacterium]|nr:HupE/UreJ family protein [Sphingomonadales bacterium]
MRAFLCLILVALGVVALVGAALAHGVAEDDKKFLLGASGPNIPAFLYLGAKHMVTGYDHLLFLAGVIFFLYRFRDIAIFVSLFSLGHSLTLITGVLAGVGIDARIIDAIIGLSVVWKAFDNLSGFETTLGFRPNLKLTVFGFGLFHGLGLAAKLQDFGLSPDGLLTNLLSFNVGVELGQLLALAFILVLMAAWRRSENFQKTASLANFALMAAGFVLIFYQLGLLFWT